jgi:hypothetical protein
MAFYSILLQFRPNIGILDQISSNNGILWQIRPNNGILQYASHVQQICASNFYFAHSFYPNLTPHETGDSDRLVLFAADSLLKGCFQNSSRSVHSSAAAVLLYWLLLNCTEIVRADLALDFGTIKALIWYPDTHECC